MEENSFKNLLSNICSKTSEAFNAVPSSSDDRKVKSSSGNTAVVSQTVTPAISNNEAVMNQKRLENELHNFSDYMSRALSALPPTLNLYVRNLPYGLDVDKISSDKYTCKIYKKESGIPFESSTYYGVLKKHLDRAFSNIRIHTENKLGFERQNLCARQWELSCDCHNPSSPFYGNIDRYNFELKMAQEAFNMTFLQNAYLLCSLCVLTYVDYDGYIILTVHCEG